MVVEAIVHIAKKSYEPSSFFQYMSISAIRSLCSPTWCLEFIQ